MLSRHLKKGLPAIISSESKTEEGAMNKVIQTTHPILNLRHPSFESFIWNTLIRTQSKPNSSKSTIASPLSIFIRMRFHNVEPDFHTFPFLLPSFNSPSHFFSAQNIHSQIIRFGFASDPFVQTSLINMYFFCDHLGCAHQVFDEITEPELPSWNSIVNVSVKMGLVDVARKLFDAMPVKNVVSWSCMLNGYVKFGKYKECLGLFREMQKLGVDCVRPNEYTMSAVLSACGKLGALEHGNWAHAYIERCGMVIDDVLGTCLIDMYAKCGRVDRARWVFDNLGSSKDVITWSAMISGFAMHGHSSESLGCFSKMICSGIRPNAVTLLGVLCACVHGGLVNEGEAYFERMTREFGIVPSIKHYGCMVDLYGRAGLIDKAWNVVNSMPMEPDVLVWGALLSGSRMAGDIKSCEIAVNKLIELEPTNSSAYVLLSNVYAKLGDWKDVRNVRDLMEIKGVKKVPGCSLIELDGVIHEFFVGDDSHPDMREIYMMLEEIMSRLKLEGYVSNTREVLLDLSEEAKEKALWHHSEKLAIAFAILKTSTGTPIRIVKNLRICRDCHVAIKMISNIYGREIVVRDCNRFHHFTKGTCSCGDYW